jgi:hypothetical protein
VTALVVEQQEHHAAQLLIEELLRTAFAVGRADWSSLTALAGSVRESILGDLRVAVKLAEQGEKEVLL